MSLPNPNSPFLTHSKLDERGTHSAAQVQKDLDDFRKEENPSQKQRDNLLESLAASSIDVAIFNKSRAEAGQRIEAAITEGFAKVTERQDITNGRINSLQEWRQRKNDLDTEQSRMIAELSDLHAETLDVLKDIKYRLAKLEETDQKLETEVHAQITKLEETDQSFSVVITKLKNWKLRIVAVSLVLLFLFKNDFIQIPDKYIRSEEKTQKIEKTNSK
jgi:hypothetical protein